MGDFGGALLDEAKKYPQVFKEAGVPAMIAGALVGGLTPGAGRAQEQVQKQVQPSRVAGAAPEGLREFLVSDSDSHSPEQLRVMEEYRNAVDPGLVKYVEDVKTVVFSGESRTISIPHLQAHLKSSA